MKTINQRPLGVKLAKQLGAVKTLAVIKDKTSTHEDIFKAAIAEVGMDKFVKCILEQEPSWAHYALRFIPNLGVHQDNRVFKFTP